MRLGKNGGTQSKWVENTTDGCADRRQNVETGSIDGQLGHRKLEGSKMLGQVAARLAFAARRGIDVDERARQRYRIHASSSVRVSVRESRYLTITGVASERPHPWSLAGQRRCARRAPRPRPPG